MMYSHPKNILKMNLMRWLSPWIEETLARTTMLSSRSVLQSSIKTISDPGLGASWERVTVDTTSITGPGVVK